MDDLVKKDVNKVHQIFDTLGLPRLTASNLKFLSEHTTVMGYVARALDILQGEKKMFYGYLAPTIRSLKRSLQDAIDVTSLTATPAKQPLEYCKPLARALLAGISKRFDRIIQQDDAILAARVHPKFKTNWLDEAEIDGVNKLLRDALIAQITATRAGGG